MKTIFRSLLMALLGALVIGALTHIDTLRAQGQTDTPAPATPPAATAPPATAPAAATPAAPSPEDLEPAPGDRISADNNVTFPTDI